MEPFDLLGVAAPPLQIEVKIRHKKGENGIDYLIFANLLEESSTFPCLVDSPTLVFPFFFGGLNRIREQCNVNHTVYATASKRIQK